MATKPTTMNQKSKMLKELLNDKSLIAQEKKNLTKLEKQLKTFEDKIENIKKEIKEQKILLAMLSVEDISNKKVSFENLPIKELASMLQYYAREREIDGFDYETTSAMDDCLKYGRLVDEGIFIKYDNDEFTVSIDIINDRDKEIDDIVEWDITSGVKIVSYDLGIAHLKEVLKDMYNHYWDNVHSKK